MQKIEQGIYYESSYPGVTIGAILLQFGSILIDAPLRAEDARSWLALLQSHAAKPNRILINLDAHPDRTLGARSLECTIVAHQKTAQVFRNRPSIFKGQNTESGSEWETYDDIVGTRWAVPDITFTSSLSLFWGDIEVVVEHHPGPTQGSAWVVIPERRVIFVGDVVMTDQPPFLTNADIPAWIETLDLLLHPYRDFQIVSGRGGLVSMKEVSIQQRHLRNILKGLEKLAKKNIPAEDIESLIPGLISDLSFPAEFKEQYIQRYRHGLYQYYTRRYRPSDNSLE